MIPRLLALAVCCSVGPLLCRFTVRDVGFVDLGDPPYQCYVVVSEEESAGAPDLHSAAKTALADTNIEFELVGLADDEDHVVHGHLRELKVERFPATILVHPDGHAIELATGSPLAESGAKVLETAANSDLRRRIADLVLQHYCVVLVLEGPDPGKNRAARSAVRASFQAIEKVFDKMPKDVGALPLSVPVSQAEQAGEKVLLWSLGIQPGSPEASVAVLTGRGRRFGSVLRGAEISEDSVLEILSKVGESCECGLDRSWMRGVRIPLRWDAETRQTAVDVLGFDPDNPLVKAEISSILAKGRNGLTIKSGGEPTVADLLLGYSEVGIDDLPEVDTQDAGAPRTEQEPEGWSLGTTVWLTLSGLIMANLCVALLLLWRSRRS